MPENISWDYILKILNIRANGLCIQEIMGKSVKLFYQGEII